MRCLCREHNSLWGHHLIAQTEELQPSKHLTTLSNSNCYALWLSWSIDQYLRMKQLTILIGFLLVIVYIFFKYKVFGFITNFTLIVNLIILLGVLTLFEATLTLPGIAGIILTVGMAVDANVLIFERIKEELKNEKNNIIAFDSGYTKSRTAILDANITTLLAAIILFFMGSGPIKGFSVTLGVGIFTTLFSVYFIARLLTAIYVSKNKDKEALI